MLNCPLIVKQLNLHCPNQRIRNNEFFRSVRHTTNYGIWSLTTDRRKSFETKIIKKKFCLFNFYDQIITIHIFKTIPWILIWKIALLYEKFCLSKIIILTAVILYKGKKYIYKKSEKGKGLFWKFVTILISFNYFSRHLKH